MAEINSHERVLVAIALILFAGVIFYNFYTLPPKNNNGGEVVSASDTVTVAVPYTTEKLSESTTESLSENESKQTDENSTININTASIDELVSLPGIGEVKAKAIIEYREKNGSFKFAAELLNVSGIGEKTYEKIREKICV